MNSLRVFLVLLVASAAALPVQLTSNKVHRSKAAFDAAAKDVVLVEDGATQLTSNKVKEPITATAIVVSILVGLATSLIYDGGKAVLANKGVCNRRQMRAINTMTGAGIDNDLLHYCTCKSLKWDSASRKNDGKKYWKVFARKWTLQQCKFNFAWQICPSRSCPSKPEVCDCRESTVAANIKKNRKAKGYLNTLKKKYPYTKKSKVWGLHVRNLKINLHSCNAAHHTAYVMPFVSLPIAAYSRQNSIASTYAKNPYFWMNIEGWTHGDCSGWKKPGVQWTFRYKVDLLRGVISFDTRRSNNRPSHSNGYVSVVSARTGLPAPRQIRGYKEKTRSECVQQNACKMN